MNFDFSDEQYMLRDNVRGFLDGEWSVKRVRQAAATAGFDRPLWEALAGLGIQGLLVPEAHGGTGMSFLDAVLILEEFGRALVPGAVPATIVGSDIVARFGSGALQQSLLPAAARGEAVLSIALAERQAGYDPAGVALAARPTAAGWHLAGTKILVPFAGSATHFIVAARVPEAGPALFVCDARTPGIALREHRIVDPGSQACEVHFDCDVAATALCSGGPAAVDALVGLGAAAAAAEMTGSASRAFEISLDYAKLREQFGQPIGAFQAIKHRFADMYTQLETARSGVYFAAWALADADVRAAEAVSAAKAYCGDACRSIVNECLQIHGGIGFTWEHDLHYYLKRCRMLEYAFGDVAWHRERVMRAALAELAA